MERLREESAGEEAATAEAKAPAEAKQRPSTVIDLPLRSEVASELRRVLENYMGACSEVKAALLKHHEEPEAYVKALDVKHARHVECMSHFERVLAHIAVRAP